MEVHTKARKPQKQNSSDEKKKTSATGDVSAMHTIGWPAAASNHEQDKLAELALISGTSEDREKFIHILAGTSETAGDRIEILKDATRQYKLAEAKAAEEHIASRVDGESPRREEAKELINMADGGAAASGTPSTVPATSPRMDVDTEGEPPAAQPYRGTSMQGTTAMDVDLEGDPPAGQPDRATQDTEEEPPAAQPERGTQDTVIESELPRLPQGIDIFDLGEDAQPRTPEHLDKAAPAITPTPVSEQAPHSDDERSASPKANDAARQLFGHDAADDAEDDALMDKLHQCIIIDEDAYGGDGQLALVGSTGVDVKVEEMDEPEDRDDGGSMKSTLTKGFACLVGLGQFPEIIDFGDLDGPGCPGNNSGPHLWKGFWGSRGLGGVRGTLRT